MNKTYGMLFAQCNPSLQSVLKIVPDYEKISNYCNFLCLMEELKNTAGLYVKMNPNLSLIEKLISFITVIQVPTETNDYYLDRFNSQIQNLILVGGKHIICCLKNVDKVVETFTPEEVTTEEDNSRRLFFCGLINLDIDNCLKI